MIEQKNAYPRRVRNTLRFRELVVLRNELVSPGFQRIVLGGSELDGFASSGFDDHIKLFFPSSPADFVPPQATEEGIIWQSDERPASRDYTPLYDAVRHELAIDFFIHDGGIASNWAQKARSGDKLFIAGPRGSLVVPENYQWQLYVCDETGMPALRRRLEMLKQAGIKAETEIKAVICVNNAESKHYLAHLSEVDITWIIGGNAQDIVRHIDTLEVPARDYFLWITGEGDVVKCLSGCLNVPEKDPQLLRAVAYWHNKAIQNSDR